MVAVEGIGTSCVLPVTKKLGHKTRVFGVLVCYNFHEDVTEDEENALFKINPNCFPYLLLHYLPYRTY